jgi:hypothetical protein
MPKNKMIDESGSVLDFVLHPNPVRNALGSRVCNKMFKHEVDRY